MAHPLERFLAILGTSICLIVTILIWRSVSAQQPMWPLPALYFIEMVAVSVLTALAVLRGRTGGLASWIAAGIFSAFSYLGALSVGFFYLPVALIFGLLAVLFVATVAFLYAWFSAPPPGPKRDR